MLGPKRIGDLIYGYSLSIICSRRMKQDLMIRIANDAEIFEYFSLEEFGINNVAFPREQALLLVDVFKKYGLSVLGGDVYMKTGSAIDITYDNWYCDKRVNESDGDFLKRSCDVAETYIKEYKRKNIIKEPLFAFVVVE